MATKKMVQSILASIKTIYPYYAKDTAPKPLVELWAAALNGITDEEAQRALIRCLQTCKAPPTPADIIEQVQAERAEKEPTAEEVWASFERSLSDVKTYLYRLKYPMAGENPREELERIWSGYPDMLKRYLVTQSEMISLAKVDDENLRFERNRFLRTMQKTAGARLMGTDVGQPALLGGDQGERDTLPQERSKLPPDA